MNMEHLRSGNVAPWSGTYKVVASNGRIIGTINVTKGDRLPPTQSNHDHFEFSEIE
jgi:hypothetical protein